MLRRPRIDVFLNSLEGAVECRAWDSSGRECDGVFIPYDLNGVGEDRAGRRILTCYGEPGMRRVRGYIGRDGKVYGLLWPNL